MQTSNLITSSVRRGAAERVIGFATAVPSVVLPSALSIERRDESGNIEPRIGTVERVEITVAPDGIRGDLGVLEQIEQHGLERVELRAGRHPGLAHDLDARRSEEHTSELQSQSNLVCRLLLEKKNKQLTKNHQEMKLHRLTAKSMYVVDC